MTINLVKFIGAVVVLIFTLIANGMSWIEGEMTWFIVGAVLAYAFGNAQFTNNTPIISTKS